MAERKEKKLRWGFTTGTAAAAATKAALICLVRGTAPSSVDIRLLTGDRLEIPVHACRRIDDVTAVCSIIKDAGDDPDITHGAEIGSRVVWSPAETASGITITGGKGVGRVTKPGLAVLPGQPAINPGPRKMIHQSVEEVLHGLRVKGGVQAEIFVPEGEVLARRTLNQRLGIIGGISILGTTGVVKPLSHAAYTATVRAALSVAKASGLQRAVLTTGRRSERFAQKKWPQIPEEGFVQIGDYFAQSMEMAAEIGLKQVILAVFFGKAVKMAQGIPHTHARSAQMSLDTLSRWAMELTGNKALARHIAAANTARHAFEMIKSDYGVVIEKVGQEMVRAARSFGGKNLDVGAIIFGFDGDVHFTSLAGMGPEDIG